MVRRFIDVRYIHIYIPAMHCLNLSIRWIVYRKEGLIGVLIDVHYIFTHIVSHCLRISIRRTEYRKEIYTWRSYRWFGYLRQIIYLTESTHFPSIRSEMYVTRIFFDVLQMCRISSRHRLQIYFRHACAVWGISIGRTEYRKKIYTWRSYRYA